VISDRLAHTLQFSVPVGKLNSLFKNSEVARVDLQISCFKADKDKPFYNYSGRLLLLPKYPVSYEIVEKYNVVKFTGAKDWEVYQKQMGPTGRPGVWHHYTITCNAPAGTRFTRKYQVSTSGSHSTCDAPKFSSDTVATVNCANQTHDAPRTATVRLEYQKSEEHVEERKLKVKTDTDGKGTLRYGTHIVELSPKNLSYTATFKYFNGKKYTLHPSKLQDEGIEAILEVSSNKKYRRLIIEVDDPLYN